MELNLAGEKNTLYVNGGAGWLEDRSHESGLPLPSLKYTSFGTALLALAVVVLAACAADPSPEAERGARPGELLPIPEPELAGLEAAVREELADSRAGVEALVVTPAQTGATLANGFGELGMLYLAHDLLEPAAACFRNAEALAPEEFRWSYYLGRASLRRSDPAAARAAFERALALAPEDLQALIALGRLALDRDAKEQARTYFQRALASNPSSAAAHVGLGRLAAAGGDFKTAATRFEEALRLQPQATAVHYALGQAYRELGDVDQARRHLELRGDRPAVEPDPLMAEVEALATGARVHLLRAGQALGAGRLDEGTAELRRAIELDPGDAAARVTLGAVLAQRGDGAGAREQFEAALRIEPGDSRAHYNLGMLAVEQGSDPESVEHFRSALDNEPEHERAAFQLGAALMRLGRSKEAVEYLARARELAPTNEMLRLQEVAALGQAGRYREARARLEEGRTVLPDSALLKHALARLLAAVPDSELRDGARALALANELVRDGGVFEGRINFDLGQTLALAYAETGQFDRAVALQEALLAAADRDGRIDALPALRENLALYRSGSGGRLPWIVGDAFLQKTSSVE